MRIAISNLAWDISEDSRIIPLLRQYKIDAIDVAPSKYFPQIQAAGKDDLARVRVQWNKEGIDIIGLQALLFGTTGLNLFAGPQIQSAMLEHLEAVCRVASGLGAQKIVFGSPKNRDRLSLSDQQVHDSAMAFFRRLGDIAGRHQVMVCLEPNPPAYGANFMNNCADTARIIEELKHPAIRMQLDTGALKINGEDPAQVLQQYADLIGYVHASEPHLAVLGEGGADHAAASSALKKFLPQSIVSIEMLAAKDQPHLPAVEKALKTAVRHYR